jgi:hypothetical protein
MIISMHEMTDEMRLAGVSGRRYHIGSIRGVNVIYALTGQRRVLINKEPICFCICILPCVVSVYALI